MSQKKILYYTSILIIFNKPSCILILIVLYILSIGLRMVD